MESEKVTDQTPRDTVDETIRRDVEAEEVRQQLEHDERTCEHCGKTDILNNMTQAKDGTWLCHPCDEKARKVEERARLKALPRATFRFNEAIDVKRLFTAFDNLLADEVVFRIEADGLHVLQMDASRTTMVAVNIERGNFEEFACTQPGCFVVDVGRIVKKPLKNVAYKGEQLSFTIGYGKANMVLQSSINRVFDITLLEMPDPYEVPPMPKIAHTVHAKLVLEALRKVLKDTTGDHLEILASDDGLKFVEHADEMPLSVQMSKGDPNLLTIERSDPSRDITRAVYSTTYLKALCEALYTLGDLVLLEFGQDLPVKMTVPMSGLRSDFAWWLAPRIESE
jgi:DNA polymerase III sliding clamp (beta) subunit (PCNA family)/ribosomal protein L37AE/L43A